MNMMKFFAVALLVMTVSVSVPTGYAGEVIPDQKLNEALRTTHITGTTDKEPFSYQKNEKMVFKFTVHPGEGLDLKDCFIRYSRVGDDGQSYTKTAPATEVLTVETSLDRAGFVGIMMHLVDAKGDYYFYHPNLNSKSGRKSIGYFAGAAVEAQALTDCGEPADFDEFWRKQRARLDAVPFKGLVELKKVDTINNVDVYTVKVPCAGPRPATAYMGIPVGAKDKSLPAELRFSGYGPSIHRRNSIAWPQDKICLLINAHGQELEKDDAYYKEFFQSIRSNGHQYAFDPEQNKDPETAFFNGMALRIMRLLDYVKTRPEWNGKDIAAHGGSQGGLQTMWAAALDEQVNEAYPSITWCCDIAGHTKKGRWNARGRMKYTPALDYYDPVFMAKRIRKAKVVITSAGMADYISPPSGVAISYNNLATPNKKIVWVQGADHSFYPPKVDYIVWENKVK